MAVYLSPGVFTQEVDLSATPATNSGGILPAFVGTAKKGPLNKPIYCTNAQQYIDNFGNTFSESYLGYAVLEYFEQGSAAWVLRVGVEEKPGQPAGLTGDVIDLTGARGNGWGRVPVFTGIDYSQIATRAITSTNPVVIHASSMTFDSFTDYDHGSAGSVDGVAHLVLTGSYTGAIDNHYIMTITGDPTSGDMAGATYEIVRNSDGAIVGSGALVGSGSSSVIHIDNGIIVQVVVDSGTLGNGDVFTFVVAPDNRSFSFEVDREAGSTPPAVYTLGVGTYYLDGSADDFVLAIYKAVVGGTVVGNWPGNFLAVESNGQVIFKAKVAGQSIQLVGSEAFALEVGQSLYAHDITRAHLISTIAGPYTISSANNRIDIIVTSQTVSKTIEFILPIGNFDAVTLAGYINLGGAVGGTRYWNAYALAIPDGSEQVVIEAANDFDQLTIQADLSHLPTYNFVEAMAIEYPYTRSCRVFNDSRTLLPNPGSSDPSVPLSCELTPGTAQCLADTAYYQNIVGWLVAKTPGTWINDYRVVLQPYNIGSSVNMFTVTIITASTGQAVDAVQNVSFDPANARYIGNVVDAGSTIGGLNGDLYFEWISVPSYVSSEVRVPGSFGPRAFAGASDGIPSDPAFTGELDKAIVGSAAANTGLYVFQSVEKYDISLLVIPGITSGAVIGQGLSLCNARGDCLMLVDPPFGLSAQQVVDWHNGILSSDMANALDTSYGALYDPWLETTDSNTGQTIFVPPSGWVSAAYAYTAINYNVWDAPAGAKRGLISSAIDTEFDITQGERDLMYGYGNAVNPIVNFPQEGIMIYGQRTLQRASTALDRVNVRMLLIYMKKNLTRSMRQFVFEPNTVQVRQQVSTVCNSFVNDIINRGGLYGATVVCDERNNTTDRIERHELHVSIFIRPTITAEFIVLTLGIMNGSVSITDQLISSF